MQTDYLEDSRNIGHDVYQDVTDIADFGAGASMDLPVQHEEGLDPDLPSPEEQLALRLLGALATMAVRSKRRQADLTAALRRSGIKIDQHGLWAALRHLESIGCIEDLVPLYDGGMLMSVTSRGIEQLNTGPRWTMFDTPSYRLA
jgi:hypothetical protein